VQESNSTFNPNGQIFTSTNYGVTWTDQGYNGLWTAVASSSAGANIVAVQRGGGDIFTSNDYGAAWTDEGNPGGSYAYWYSVASSSTGNDLVGVEESPGFPSTISTFTSNNYGATWTNSNNLGQNAYVASSSTGSNIVVAQEGGDLLTSTNYGATWTDRGDSGSWYAIASSSDGTHLVLAANNGDLFTANITSGVANYAKYDNGAKVFNLYDNFAGNTLTSTWSIQRPGGIPTVNNGITMNGISTANYIYSSGTYNSLAYVLDGDGYQTYTSGPPANLTYVERWTSVAGGSYLITMTSGSGYTDYSISTGNSGSYSYTNIASASQSSASVWSLISKPSGGSTGCLGYATCATNTAHSLTVSTATIYSGVQAQIANKVFLQWIRLRAMPPNAVMPSATFGNVIT
jgi:hypothetical protein